MKFIQKIELSIAENYVKEWSQWAGVREFIQNYLDGVDEGFPGTIKFASDSLTLINKLVVLERKTLLLGASTKDAQSNRGQFGEGYKLACLALLRTGATVVIRTANEVWIPIISDSDSFGTKVLAIDIFQVADHTDAIQIELSGLALTSAQIKALAPALSDRFTLAIAEPTQMTAELVRAAGFTCGFATIGGLFCKGLFVQPLNADFDYNLTIALNRDRTIATDHYSLLYKSMCALIDAADHYPITQTRTGSHEEKTISEYGQGFSTLEKIWNSERPDELPVYGDEGGPAFSGLGRTLVVSPAWRKALEKSMPSLKAALLKIQCQYEVLVTEESMGLYHKALRCLEELESLRAAPDRVFLQIVKFKADDMLGLYEPRCDGTKTNSRDAYNHYTLISLSIDLDEHGLYSTLIHEYAHHWGTDGSNAHLSAIQGLFADYFCKQLGKEGK